MSNWVWIALLAAALVAVANFQGRKVGPCCEVHASHDPEILETGYCSTRGY